jgi:O-6-methylguanine DNA methyltransferase
MQTSGNQSFSERVRTVVRNIPKGTVMTYRAVAVAAGNPKAARAVARVMAKNYDETVPCHRVIRSDGSLGGYNRGGVPAKKALLLTEGYQIT